MNFKSLSKKLVLAMLVLSLTLLAGSLSLSAAPLYDAYILCGNANNATVYLLDKDGKQVKTWKGSSGSHACGAYLLPDGSVLIPLSSSCNSGALAHPNGLFQRIDKNGNIMWNGTYCPSGFTPGYDIEPLPNGDFLAIGYPNKCVQLKGSANGYTLVKEFACPSGSYLNSVGYNSDTKQIIVENQSSSSKVTIIDFNSGSAVKTISSSGTIHGAEWVTDKYQGTDIPIPGADKTAMRVGNVILVNNSQGQAQEYNTSGSLVKSLSYNFYDHEGSVQRLPNGNTFVARGYSNAMAELDETGKSLKTWTAPASVYRAYKYDKNYPGIQAIFGTPTPPPQTPTPTPTRTPTPTTPIDQPVKLSCGKTVYVSSEYSTFVKGNAVDCNESTAWGALKGTTEQYIIIDLTKVTKLTKIVINWLDPYFANQYIVGGSNDLKTWATTDVILGNGGVDPFDISSSGISFRYIGVLCKGTTNVGYAIKELEVWGIK